MYFDFDYIDTAEAARLLGYRSTTAFRRMARREGLPTIYLGRHVLYRRSSLERWLSEREIGRRRAQR